jgi:hypothetical protein
VSDAHWFSVWTGSRPPSHGCPTGDPVLLEDWGRCRPWSCCGWERSVAVTIDEMTRLDWRTRTKISGKP